MSGESVLSGAYAAYLAGNLNLAQDKALKAWAAGGDEAAIFKLISTIRADQVRQAQAERQQKSVLAQRLGNQIMAQQYIQALLAEPRFQDPLRLERHGKRITSQNDEDGILAEIFRRIGVVHKTFVEIGVGNGLENNTYALMQQGWRGTWVDANQPKVAFIREHFAQTIASGQLEMVESLVNAENVNGLLGRHAGQPEIDCLSIDIDGNDYHVWKAITAVNPRVAVVEYNAKYPPPASLVQTYDPDYTWAKERDGGASLGAMVKLGAEKGYQLVGCNLTGVNAFFVRRDLAGDRFVQPATAEHLYHPARYFLWEAGGFPIGGQGNMAPKLEV